MEDIFTITILGVICGCEDWEDISLYGQGKEEFLRRFLTLPNGIPSADTFERLFIRINPEQFENCFIKWVSHLGNQAHKGLINIDGKTLRGISKKGGSKSVFHMISAWSNENQMVLGQFKVESKSNEITAIPMLLDLLDISGSVVTIDAMGCQKQIAEKIIENGADYILGLKGNQESLKDEVENAFKQCPANSEDESFDKDHGRKRMGNSAENFALIRKMALNIIKNDKSTKLSINRKRLKAMLYNEYLIKLISL